MSYKDAQSVTLSDKEGIFSGGLVDNVTSVDMAPNYSPYLRNVRLDGQSAVIRPGFQVLANLTAGSYPKGIGSYLRTNSANDCMIVRHNTDATHKLYTITDVGVATSIDTGANITSDNRMTFQNVADVMYCMNGSDKMGKLSGTTYTTIDTGLAQVVFNNVGLNDFSAFGCNTVHTFIVTIDGLYAGATPDTFKRNVDGGAYTTGVQISAGTNIPLSLGMTIKFDNFRGHTIGSSWTITTASLTPAFGAEFNSSMFIAGIPGNENIVYKSVGNKYEDFNNIGSDRFTFSETIKGLTVASQSIFFFTRSTISVIGSTDITDNGTSISYVTRSLETKEGSIGNSTIVAVGNEVYYITPSNSINKIARGANVYGFDVISLSDRKYKGITKTMATLDSDQSNAFGYFLPAENLIKRHMKSEGSTLNDICIVYDIIKDRFLVDGQKYFYDGIAFKGKNYTVSMIEPKVYRDEYGQTDESSPIQFEYRTKEFYISEATHKKVIRESRTLLDINELAAVTQNILIDGIQRDSKTIGLANYLDAGGGGDGGIGDGSMGDYAIGDDGSEEDTSNDSDYIETYILRTKGNLNKKGRKFQFQFLCSSLAGKVRLKNIETMFEVLNGLATNLTK